MPFTGIVNPKQLAVLTSALQSYCRENRIEVGSPEYYDVGRLALGLFKTGITTAEDLGNALRRLDDQKRSS